MSAEDSGKWDISVCGLNCAKCDIYQTYHGNDELLKEILDWFRRERNKIIRPESINCGGCRGPLDVH